MGYGMKEVIDDQAAMREDCMSLQVVVVYNKSSLYALK